jgi:beta-glucanase (GH16 family)
MQYAIRALWLPAAAVLISLGYAAAAEPPPGYKLVWSDEFNYHGLPDPAKWGYEEGFVRNHESQYYTKARAANARVEDGALVIEGRKERFPIERGGQPAREAQYTSASLITLGKASWQYGRIEVRARLPHGKGVWPAIWMMGANEPQVGWPACGEVDVMEFVGHTPDRVFATVHWGSDYRHHQSAGQSLKVSQPWEDFHVYAVEWTPERMDFFYDQTCYHRFQVQKAAAKEENAFRRPHYLLLNLALGGEWGGQIDDALLPQRFVVDYVRVYQKAPAAK